MSNEIFKTPILGFYANFFNDDLLILDKFKIKDESYIVGVIKNQLGDSPRFAVYRFDNSSPEDGVWHVVSILDVKPTDIHTRHQGLHLEIQHVETLTAYRKLGIATHMFNTLIGMGYILISNEYSTDLEIEFWRNLGECAYTNRAYVEYFDLVKSPKDRIYHSFDGSSRESSLIWGEKGDGFENIRLLYAKNREPYSEDIKLLEDIIGMKGNN